LRNVKVGGLRLGRVKVGEVASSGEGQGWRCLHWGRSRVEVALVEEHQGWTVEVGERQDWRWLHLEKVKVGGSRLGNVKIGGGFG